MRILVSIVVLFYLIVIANNPDIISSLFLAAAPDQTMIVYKFILTNLYDINTFPQFGDFSAY